MEQHLSAHGAYLILVHLSCPKESLASPLSRIYSSKTSKDILRLRVWRPRPWFPRWGAPCSVGTVAPAHIRVILVFHTKNSKKNIVQRQVKFFHWRLLNFNVGKFDVPMWKWEGGVKRILRLGRLLGGVYPHQSGGPEVPDLVVLPDTTLTLLLTIFPLHPQHCTSCPNATTFNTIMVCKNWGIMIIKWLAFCVYVSRFTRKTKKYKPDVWDVFDHYHSF